MARNVIFAGLPNVADKATITVGSPVASLPASNMQTRVLSQVARIGGVGLNDTVINVDLLEPQVLQVFALLKNNLSYFSTLQIQASITPGFEAENIVYDSGVSYAIPDIQQGGILGWGIFGWGNTVPFEELKQITVNTVHIAPAAVVARYVRFTLADSTNPDGFIDIGRMIISSLTETGVNPDYGMRIGYVDRSTDSEADDGTIHTDRRKPYRQISMNFSNLSEAEAMEVFFNRLNRDKGTFGDFLVIPQPDKLEQLNNQAIYGKLVTTGDVEFTAWNLFSTGVQIRELI